MHYEVRFTVKLPDGISATPKEAEDWLRFYLHDNCSLAGTNPLIDHEPEPLRGTFRVFQLVWEPLYDQAALDAAVAAERERCAKVCEAVHADTAECPELALYCAERIRAA